MTPKPTVYRLTPTNPWATTGSIRTEDPQCYDYKTGILLAGGVGSLTKGVFKSTDGGTTWTLVTGAPTSAASVCIKDSTHWFVATPFVTPHTGFAVTTDGGATWTVKGPADFGFNHIVGPGSAVTLASIFFGLRYVGTGFLVATGNFFIRTPGTPTKVTCSKIVMSTDDGATWQMPSSPSVTFTAPTPVTHASHWTVTFLGPFPWTLPTLHDDQLASIPTIPQGPSTHLLSSDWGGTAAPTLGWPSQWAFSNDGGMTWSYLFTGGQPTGPSVRYLGWDGSLFFYSAGSAVFDIGPVPIDIVSSADGGVTWHTRFFPRAGNTDPGPAIAPTKTTIFLTAGGWHITTAPTVTVPAPNRQYPRDDNLGVGSPRQRGGKGGPSSRQHSNRQGHRGTYS